MRVQKIENNNKNNKPIFTSTVHTNFDDAYNIFSHLIPDNAIKILQNNGQDNHVFLSVSQHTHYYDLIMKVVKKVDNKLSVGKSEEQLTHFNADKMAEMYNTAIQNTYEIKNNEMCNLLYFQA